MPVEPFHYEVDGTEMVGRLALPEGASGRRPAVLVFPHAFGPGDHSLGKAKRLADELGYVALECDLHGGGEGFAAPEAMERLKPLRESAEVVRARTHAPLQALLARGEVDPSRVAAIGFCFGGTMAYELALSGADIRAAIGFHSGLKVTSPGDAGQIRGKVLTMVGADDPGIPPEARDAFVAMLKDAGVDYTLTVYGGVVHSFTDLEADKLGRPDVARYDANADRRSWAQMSEMLAEVFG